MPEKPEVKLVDVDEIKRLAKTRLIKETQAWLDSMAHALARPYDDPISPVGGVLIGNGPVGGLPFVHMILRYGHEAETQGPYQANLAVRDMLNACVFLANKYDLLLPGLRELAESHPMMEGRQLVLTPTQAPAETAEETGRKVIRDLVDDGGTASDGT